MSHTVGTPAMAVPTMLPTAPMTSATANDTMPSTIATTALAPITRPRCGTRVNVVSPLRWLHSLVTERIAINGSSSAIGMPIAAPKLS